MKNLKIVFTILFQIIVLSMNAQNGEFYSIETALENPKEVKILYLNFNFTEIRDLPKEIEVLKNLEELVFFPRMFEFPKIEGKAIIKDRLDDSDLKSVATLPSEITECKKLRIMNFSGCSLQKLPSNLNDFPDLEIIRLSGSSVNLNDEIENLLTIENKVTLDIFNCEISKMNVEKLRAKENFKVLASEEDYKISSEITDSETVDLQIHSSFFVFPNLEQANKFINSMPDFLQETARKSIQKQ